MLQLFNESRGKILLFKRFLFGKGQAVCYCLANGKFADSCPTQRHKIQILKKAACAVLWANNQSNMHSGFIHLSHLQMSKQEIVINSIPLP